MSEFRLAGSEQGSPAGTEFSIFDGSIDNSDIGYANVYPKNHPDVEREDDWNPPFQIEAASNTADTVDITIEFFLVPNGQDSVASGFKLGENNSTIGAYTSTYSRRFSHSEMMESGFETGVEHHGYVRVTGAGQTSTEKLRNVLLQPPLYDPGAVSIFTCDSSDSSVSPNTETGFTAQVTNNNDVTVQVDVEWYADGTLVGNTLSDIPPNTGRGVSNTGVSHGYLLNHIGSGDFDLTATIAGVSAP